tara:strand:+ start:687 stop:845 length:159 start_codon:yes stop_codon:yes gene_type:complete
MKKIALFFLLTACTTSYLENEVLNFDRDLSFQEFKKLLIKYNKNNKYPDIDN